MTLTESTTASTDSTVTRLHHVIDGAAHHGSSGRYLPLVDPATGRIGAEMPIADAGDVEQAMQAAQRAFATWRTSTPAERQLALLKIADLMEARAEEFMRAEARNTGKPITMLATEELPPCIDQLRFFAGAARTLEGRAGTEYTAGFTSYVRREPIGVVAQVAPWNYPLMMAVWKVGAALAAGNTVVLKPSETTPESTVLFAEVAASVLPAGVFNVVCGDRDTGQALVRHAIPQMVAITGSTRAGTQVASDAARDVKRTHLELGGKAPVIVFADVDIDAAATAIAGAGLFNAGQDCTAATRVIVQQDIAEEFTAALAAAAAGTAVGDPQDEQTVMGPLNNVDQLRRVQGFVERLPSHARVVTGGHRISALGDGYYFAPTVVADLQQDDEIIRDEVFGPVLTVQTFTDEAAAVRMANDCEFGLAASVWTRDVGRAHRMTRDLDFGVVWVNSHLTMASEMPHGGFKHSGYGKDMSVYAVEEYTRVKHVMVSLD